jgi:hypothetical protein
MRPAPCPTSHDCEVGISDNAQPQEDGPFKKARLSMSLLESNRNLILTSLDFRFPEQKYEIESVMPVVDEKAIEG